MSTVHVYVTSLIDAQWERRTGIPRVEYEIARDAVGRGGRLITFSKLRRTFVEIDRRAVQAVVAVQDRDLGGVLDGEHGKPSVLSRTAGQVLSLVGKGAGGRAGARLLAMATPALPVAERRRLAHEMGLFDDAPASIRYIEALTAKEFGKPRRAEMKPGDVIVVPGIVWSRTALRALSRLPQSSGVLMAPFIHDLMPIRHPEFFTNATGGARFRRFIDTMLHSSPAGFANSSFVAGDVASYAREAGLPQIPMHPIPLCANLSRETPAMETPRLRALGLRSDGYVLFVSTFSPRKNQLGAYRIWKRLIERLGPSLPPLVLAGQRGWRSDGVFAEMKADAAMWGRYIHYVEAPTDAELAHLYGNCAFTVFPSLHEGWGLPITESLDFGKPCIAADNSALPEAGQGLALHLDAHDLDGWVAAARQLIESPQKRAVIASRIRAAYRRRTWRQVGDEIHAVAAAIAARAGHAHQETPALPLSKIDSTVAPD